MKLWIEAPQDFSLAVHGESAGGGRWGAPGLRALFWPSGRACWQVNAYLISLRKRGLATSTVNTYCSELSRLVRFLERKGLAFEDVADEHLIAYSESLLRPSMGHGVSANHANRLVLRAVELLAWLQDRLPGRPLVGMIGESAQISVSTRAAFSKSRGGSLLHPALVAPSVRRLVRPMTSDSIRRLQSACASIGKTEFTKARNLAMLKLLADSGIRREELVWVRLEDLDSAVRLAGRLKIRTAKRRGNPVREVPVPVETLKAVQQFVDVHRRLQIRRLLKRRKIKADGGWAFCTRSGGRLAAATVSQIFSDLRGAAQLEGRATAHMLRHRWITLQLIQRLRALQGGHPSGLQVMTTVLSRLASITGHSSIDSLWTYVDWAYDERTSDSAEDGDSQKWLRVPIEVVDLLAKAIDDTSGQSSLAPLRSSLIDIRDSLERHSKAAAHLGEQTVAAHSLRSGRRR